MTEVQTSIDLGVATQNGVGAPDDLNTSEPLAWLRGIETEKAAGQAKASSKLLAGAVPNVVKRQTWRVSRLTGPVGRDRWHSPVAGDLEKDPPARSRPGDEFAGVVNALQGGREHAGPVSRDGRHSPSRGDGKATRPSARPNRVAAPSIVSPCSDNPALAPDIGLHMPRDAVSSTILLVQQFVMAQALRPC